MRAVLGYSHECRSWLRRASYATATASSSGGAVQNKRTAKSDTSCHVTRLHFARDLALFTRVLLSVDLSTHRLTLCSVNAMCASCPLVIIRPPS